MKNAKFKVGDKVIVRNQEAAGSGKEPHDREGVVIAILGSGVYRVNIGGIAVLYSEGDLRSANNGQETRGESGQGDA